MFRHVKGIVKGLTWRAFAALDTAVVVAVVTFYKTGTFTGVGAVVLGIVGVETITKTFLYAVHERLWEQQFLAKWF